MPSAALSPLLLLRSPLGDDTKPLQQGTLHAIALHATERLSTPFHVRLTAVSTKRAIQPAELLFQPVALTVRRKDGLDRHFHGIVQRMEAVGLAQRGRFQYVLDVVPKLWFLGQKMDCRVFQRRTTQQILQLLFAEHKVEPVEFRLTGPKPLREYTTQFNETDLEFAHRIMQESGYFYFFEHAAGSHTLVVTDSNQAFRTLKQPLHRVIHRGDNADIFDAWSEAAATAWGRIEIQDYDPTKSAKPVTGRQAARTVAAGSPQRSFYGWPAMTQNSAVATDRARFRMEAAEAAAALREGHGTDPNLCPGFRFLLERDPFTGAESVEHVVHGATHAATDETWLGGTAPPSVECGFTSFLQKTAWREPLSQPRPAMTGIFSAIVLGQAGEEIHADPLARIKVRLLFDHRQDTVAGMAIWVRILHAWAGSRWGWQHLPRVGTEVGVSFMNGDPDNPVVVGCFYHDDMPPVFPVPDEQTKQGFRSRSTLRGGPQEYSELSFDDRRGRETVLLHAQRDHAVEVEHDQNVTVGRNRTVETTVDDSLTSLRGNISVEAKAGAVTVTAATRITLQVGASSIVMTPGSITITTPLVSVETAELNATTGATTVETAELNLTTAAFTAETAAFELTAPEVTFVTPVFFAPFPIPLEA